MKQQTVLSNTGERMAPEFHRGKLIYAEHLIRYEAALGLVAGKVVLDIASGSGYGTKLLASTASKVIGVDLDAEAIEYAKQNYAAENIQYLLGNATGIPLEDHSVDVVISFETLEHVEGYEAFLKEIKRVLHPKGVAVISTPNKDEFAEGNHFHVHEFTYPELSALLSKYFEHVIDNFQATWKFVALGPKSMFDLTDFTSVSIKNLSPLTSEQGLYFYMVCSDQRVDVALDVRAALGEHYSDKDLVAKELAHHHELSSIKIALDEERIRNLATVEALGEQLSQVNRDIGQIKKSKSYRITQKIHLLRGLLSKRK